MPAYCLRRLRQDRRLTLEALAYLTRMSPAAISMIERGERSPTPETVVALARGPADQGADPGGGGAPVLPAGDPGGEC
jgi:transcriptional regulator with XRE-family HTH domain